MAHPDNPGVLPPLLAAVRRRHPDIDIVVLPPEQQAAGPELDETAVGSVVAEVAAVAGEITGAEVAPSVGPGPQRGTVRVRASQVVPAGADDVRTLRDRLVAGGWQVRQHGAGRLVGRREGEPGLRLRVSSPEGRGAMLVELTSAPLRVGDRARELVRG